MSKSVRETLPLFLGITSFFGQNSPEDSCKRFPEDSRKKFPEDSGNGSF